MTCYFSRAKSVLPSLAILWVALLAAPQATNAVTIFDNFGPDPGFIANNWAVYQVPGEYRDVAVPFTALATSPISLLRAEVVLEATSGSDTVLAQIMADSGGNPGSVLATSSVIAPTVTGGAIAGTYFSDAGSLTIGTQYWLVLSMDGVSGNNAWHGTSAGAPLPFAKAKQGSGWVDLGAPFPAARMETIPEPSSIILLLMGIAGLFARARRRQR